MTFARAIPFVLVLASFTAFAQDAAQVPKLPHWVPMNTPASAYLDTVEGICRVLATFQDEHGAIIDPYLGKEHQYSTPYFAAAVGVLLHEGRAEDLKEAGIRAVEHTMAAVSGGHETIPDGHGEFFLAPLASIVTHYADVVPAARMASWREIASKPIDEIIEGRDVKINNWRTYAMRGEDARARAGLSDRRATDFFLEEGWEVWTQRERIVNDDQNLYQDWNGDPQSHAVEAVGRVNLLALGKTALNLNGLETAMRLGNSSASILQDPTGQCPPNGRTDNHVFNDVLYCLGFHLMAERTEDVHARGRYLRAARLAFSSIDRWKETEGARAGAFFVTKNRFDPADRVGYQPASQYTNYNATVAFHLAEAYEFAKQQEDWKEYPARCESGSFILESDPAFGSVAAHASGMHLFLNLRGDSVPKYGTYWTPLGVVRFSRKNWDSRLGPPDGHYDARKRRGVTFAPTWKQGDRWIRLSERVRDYRGILTKEYAKNDSAAFTVLYTPVTGSGGPSFRHRFVLTPMGVHATLTSTSDVEFGVTLPVLVDDGTPLDVTEHARYVGTQFPEGTDSQYFIAVGSEVRIEEDGERLQSSVGWLQPYLQTSTGDTVITYVYPRGADDPAVEDLLDRIPEDPIYPIPAKPVAE